MKINPKLCILVAFILGLFVFALPNQAEAKITKVKSYYKKSSGSYVMPHYRSYRDSYKWNNWSSKGNYNIFTGEKGYKK